MTSPAPTSDALLGPIGTATRLPLDLLSRHCVTAWFLHLPGVHPFWQHYRLSVVDLAPDPEMRPPVLQYPGAQYELLVIALDPERRPEALNPTTWSALLPVNIALQFHGTGVGGAVRLAEQAARWIVDGRRWVETSDIRGEREAWAQALQAAVYEQRLALG